MEVGDFFEAGKDGFALGVVDFLAAGVVGTALHVADAELVGEVLLEEGDVFVEELFLEVLGAGRDHDALGGENGGDKIGERLAGARAGFDEEVLAFRDGGFDGLRHFELTGAELVIGMPLGEGSAGREETTRAYGAGFLGHPDSNPLWKTGAWHQFSTDLEEFSTGLVFMDDDVGRLRGADAVVFG